MLQSYLVFKYLGHEVAYIYDVHVFLWFFIFRPINAVEKKQCSYSVVDGSSDKREVTVKERLGINPTTKTFNFDHVFPPEVKQVQIYKSIVSPIISEVLSGYNCTIFA